MKIFSFQTNGMLVDEESDGCSSKELANFSIVKRRNEPHT